MRLSQARPIRTHMMFICLIADMNLDYLVKVVSVEATFGQRA